MSPTEKSDDKVLREEQASVDGEPATFITGHSAWMKRLSTSGVEIRGIHPVEEKDRTDAQFFKIFFVWFSCNFNILSFSAGTLGPVVFGLGVRDSCLVILLFNLVCAIPPAYFATFGPKLGLRQMVHSRFSFGYYGVIVPCIFNLIGMTGFCILNCIVGGQTLAVAAGGNFSWTTGIVILSVISLLVSFCGYKVLLWYERLAWVPVLVVFLVALGISGKSIESVGPPPGSPLPIKAIMAFGSTIAGYTMTWSALSSDFTIYMQPRVSSMRIFIYSYVGLLLPIVSLQCLGAAVSASALGVPIPKWIEGYDDGAHGNVGGLISAMILPTGNFGKFLTVLLSLSVAPNVATTFYCISLNFQIFIPVLLVVPRFCFAILATAIVMPLSIIGSHRFYDTLVNFLSLIGYWNAAWVAIILGEHLYFKKGDFKRYDIPSWNLLSQLPLGFAALGAAILSISMIVPCMEQVWFVGPIGKHTGDIGFEVAFVVAGVAYIPLRTLELRIRRR